MPLTIKEYLSEKGAVELLCEIHPQGSRFEELVEEVGIARPTVSNRLAQGREVSLFGQEATPGERGTSHKHVLTPKGATLRMLMEEHGVVITYHQLKAARQQFQLKSEEFGESVVPSQNFEDRSRNESSLHKLQNIPRYADSDDN